jgi:hypothetical protein
MTNATMPPTINSVYRTNIVRMPVEFVSKDACPAGVCS